MKKAVKITGVIWGILCIINVILFVIMGAIFIYSMNNAEFLAKMATELNRSEDVVKQACGVLVALSFNLAIYCVAGTVFSFVLVGKVNSNMHKGPGIALGIISAVFGALLPAIFFIVDSAITRE